jgi:hypothetical protein
MRRGKIPAVFVFLIIFSGLLCAKDTGPSAPPPLSSQNRLELIRTFTADLVYIRTNFPIGKTGLTLKDGRLTPSGDQLQQLLSLWGPSVKPGDRAIISSIEIKKNHIVFVVNGGPIRKKKWYQHIEVGIGNTTSPIAPDNPANNARGTLLDLEFDHYVPDLTPARVEQMLQPVFDFHSTNALEAYLMTVPPNVREAIKQHRVLVGMNQEMVIYAKGRAPKKIREKDSTGTEYEEWIYGEPPEDVDFVRFIGDEVTRVEIMKVDGEKIVRTAKEVNLPKVASTPSAPQPQPANAPTLRRPGEQLPDGQAQPQGQSAPMQQAPTSSPDPGGSGDPGPNYL